MPTVSHAPPLPRISATAAPMPIPSAIPNPICMDGRFILNSVVGDLFVSLIPGCFVPRARRPEIPTLESRIGEDFGFRLLFPSVCWRERLRRLWFLVPDRPHLPQQFGYAHAGKGLEQSRHL